MGAPRCLLCFCLLCHFQQKKIQKEKKKGRGRLNCDDTISKKKNTEIFALLQRDAGFLLKHSGGFLVR